jgi:23S rRNA (uridine2552-2'-O)-methyltransferase
LLASLYYPTHMKVRTKSKKVNKAWLNDHLNDPYVKLAQKEGYRARAAYKLKEIDETLGLIRPGHLVVDLGSTPGAWSQYVRRKLAPEGRGFRGAGRPDHCARPAARWSDRRRDLPAGRLRRTRGAGSAGAGRRGPQGRRGACRDMAPNLSGIESVEAARISRTWWSWPLDFSRLHLKPEGALVAKVFHGSGYSSSSSCSRNISSW